MKGLFDSPFRGIVQSLVVAFALIAVSTGIANAQEEPPPPAPPAEVEAPAKPRGPKGPPPVESRLERMMDRLTTDLELSEEQATRVREILEARMTKQRELFDERGEEDRAARQEMQAEMMKLRAEGDAEIKELLDDKQSAKYDEVMKDHGPQRGRRRGMRGRRGS
ncbi:MAG: hypothetical protein KJO98_15255 [Rhodothermia bacterium]|nr:hypothetical protein [Rhodothermia bacterium]